MNFDINQTISIIELIRTAPESANILGIGLILPFLWYAFRTKLPFLAKRYPKIIERLNVAIWSLAFTLILFGIITLRITSLREEQLRLKALSVKHVMVYNGWLNAESSMINSNTSSKIDSKIISKMISRFPDQFIHLRNDPNSIRIVDANSVEKINSHLIPLLESHLTETLKVDDKIPVADVHKHNPKFTIPLVESMISMGTSKFRWYVELDEPNQLNNLRDGTHYIKRVEN
ncbi:hypothetical protein ACFL6U_18570 [Planctomycetota bacterium]